MLNSAFAPGAGDHGQGTKKTFLTNHFVFDALSDGDIGLLLDNTHSKKYVADEVIFFKGDPTTGMMAVVSGCVQIRIVSEDGK